jgi:Mycobacterium membrane protein
VEVERGAVAEPDVQTWPEVSVANSRDDRQQPEQRRGLFRRGRRRSSAPQTPAGPISRRRNRGAAIFRFFGRLWIPLVIVAVVVTGGLSVARLHGMFGSEHRPSYADTRQQDTKPFNPKHVKYEVFGPPGAMADISYFDANGEPKHINGVELPWSFDISTTLPSIVGNVVAQGNSDSLGCRIVVDGVVKSEKISHELNAFTYCVLTAT